jgi:RNA polymerase sigma-32 factor
MKEKNYLLSNNLVEYSRRAKVLSKSEEYKLILLWHENRDQDSLQKIINAYLRLAVSFAKKYKNYGLPLEDLIHEGVIGIMRAIEKFDISKEFRLSTYASWWIRASIQDYILKNWSIVRTGSTASQKSLFFNLRKIKQKIMETSKDYMGQKEIDEVSEMLKVKSIDIQNMESRLAGGDVFLNQPIGDEDGNDLMSLIEDNSLNPEELLESSNDTKLKKNWLMDSLNMLTDREKTIIKERKLNYKSTTLDELGKILNISKERVRQIENRALSKLQKYILEVSQQEKKFFI